MPETYRHSVIPFTQVPNELITCPGVTANALRVWCYIQMRSGIPDWQVHAKDVQKSLGIGRDAWTAACKSLIEHGFMLREKTQDKSGKIVWVYTTIAGLSSAGSSSHGSTSAGSSGPLKRKTEEINTKQREREDSAAPIDDAMASIEAENERPILMATKTWKDLQTMRLVRVTKPQDEVDICDLIERHGWDAVVKACEALKSGIQAPYPSQVAEKLDGKTLSRQKAIEILRNRLREKYEMEKYIGNDFLDELITKADGVGKEMEACHKQHNIIYLAWLKQCIDQKTITWREEERSNEWLIEQARRFV